MTKSTNTFLTGLHQAAMTRGEMPVELLADLAAQLAADSIHLIELDAVFIRRPETSEEVAIPTCYRLLGPALCAMSAERGDEAYRMRLGWLLADWFDAVDPEDELLMEELMLAGLSVGPAAVEAGSQKLLETPLDSPAWRHLWRWMEILDPAADPALRGKIGELAAETARRLTERGQPIEPSVEMTLERSQGREPERIRVHDPQWITKHWAIWQELEPPAPPQRGRRIVEPIVNEAPKTGRNDPCPCGSGKKFKKCCGK